MGLPVPSARGTMHHSADLPSLKASVRLGRKGASSNSALYDVKFYPYAPPGGEAVFAAAGYDNLMVCRPALGKHKAIEIVRWFKDITDKEPLTHSLTWAKDPETGDPLLCISGASPKIKVLNVKKSGDSLARTLIGHGLPVNDLATSPFSPSILASAAEDRAVRVWNLDPRYTTSPCSVMCAGDAHRAPLLTVCWHENGRFLMSGGMDSVVSLWLIPDLREENREVDDIKVIHYPHFSSAEVHTEYIDCIKFYGDMIISRSAKENKILLWRIDGLSSEILSNPSAFRAPTSSAAADGGTHSAFSTGSARFQRLLQFDTPNSNFFYMRFGLLNTPGKRPILAAGNEKSKMQFWDLQRVREGLDTMPFGPTSNDHRGAGAGGGRRKKTHHDSLYVPGSRGLYRAGSSASMASEVSSAVSGVSSANASNWSSATSNSAPVAPVVPSVERRSFLGDPFAPIPPHKSAVMNKTLSFATRQVAWSPGGEWCVAVGDHGAMAIFRRWENLIWQRR